MRGCSDAKHYERMTHSFVGLLILRRRRAVHQSEEQPRQPRQPRQPTTAIHTPRHATPKAAGETVE